MFVASYGDRRHKLRPGKREGTRRTGDSEITILVKGEEAMLNFFKLDAGFDNPDDVHPFNESIGYVISGKLEMRIGDELHILGPGSAWVHPKGVRHTAKALEPSTVLEFMAPVLDDVVQLFEES